MKPWEFLEMTWCDWQRYVQGYIIRNDRYLQGVRKISYFSLLAAGAKRVREQGLFRLTTDPIPPKPKPEERLTKEKLDAISKRYFG